MDWILFYQNERSNVSFVTDLSPDEPRYKGYREFLIFLSEVCSNIVLKKSFIDTLDSFQTILLHVASGEWKVLYPELPIEEFEKEIYDWRSKFEKPEGTVKQRLKKLTDLKKVFLRGLNL